MHNPLVQLISGKKNRKTCYLSLISYEKRFIGYIHSSKSDYLILNYCIVEVDYCRMILYAYSYKYCIVHVPDYTEECLQSGVVLAGRCVQAESSSAWLSRLSARLAESRPEVRVQRQTGGQPGVALALAPRARSTRTGAPRRRRPPPTAARAAASPATAAPHRRRRLRLHVVHQLHQSAAARTPPARPLPYTNTRQSLATRVPNSISRVIHRTSGYQQSVNGIEHID